jgi:prephenate dehydrogenase
MARVTVLGLGNMGGALARSFEAACHATNGW